jgi:hypothetical protein
MKVHAVVLLVKAQGMRRGSVGDPLPSFIPHRQQGDRGLVNTDVIVITKI